MTGRKRSHPGGGRNNWEARRGQSRRRFHSINTKNTPAAAIAPTLLCSVCQQVENPKYKCPKCRESYCSIPCCRDHKAQGCKTPDTAGNNSKEQGTQHESSASAVPVSKYLPQKDLMAMLQQQQKQSPNTDAGSPELPMQNDRKRDDHVYGKYDNDEDPLEDNWKITQQMMDALEGSDWLQKELKDVGLRHLITSIDGASDRVTKRNNTKTRQEHELGQAKMNYPAFSRFVDKLLVLTGVLERQPSAPGEDPGVLTEWLQQDEGNDNSLLVLKTESRPPRRKLSPTDTAEEDSDSSGNSEDSDESSDDTDTSSNASGSCKNDE